MPALTDAGRNKASLSESFDFLTNLRLAASGDPEAMRRMNLAMRHSTLRDNRLDRPVDLQRAQSRFERNRALESSLTSSNNYARRPDPPAPMQTAATAAKPIARFLPNGKRPKSDPCNGAKGIWGRAAKGVI